MARMLLPAFLVLALAVLSAAPADAQSRRDLVLRIDALEQRLNEAEARSGGSTPVEDLLGRVESLEREQRMLTGEIERLGFENRQLRSQLDTAMEALQSGSARRPAASYGEDEYGDDYTSDDDLAIVDPDNPFADTYREATRPLGSPGSGQPAPLGGGNGANGGGAFAAPSGLDPDALFQRGRARLLDGDFGGAQDAFADFTEYFSDDPQAGQAWYWLGETHFIQGEYQDAADSYLASLRAERRGARAPDALVRLGASLAAMDQTSEACDVLSTFNSEFPNADADARRRAERESTRAGCR
ncbi:tol-pal system protein YbgF [Glycocaulis profundi]|nr:tol-pal system protein YbgF [Glycocaulis profundi]